MVDRYESTKCISHLFGHDHRKRKTDRLIKGKFKLDRRISASTVKVGIENERGISLHVDIIRKRAHEVRPVARKKPYMNKNHRGKRFNPLTTGSLFLDHQFFGKEKNVYFTLNY